MSFVPYEDLRRNFSIALGFGLIGTAALTLGDFNPLTTMAPPLFAMVFYFLWFRDKSKLQSQVEQFADSFYYLGFLFTLGALALSLIPWALDSTEVTPESVISKLGIALLTTIIGLSGRVYLTQFLVSEEQAVADIQKRLREGARSLASELDLIVENFQSVREKATEQLESMVADAGEQLKESFKLLADDVGTTSERFTSEFAELAENIGAVGNGVTQLNKHVAGLSKTVNGVNEQLTSVEAGADQYSKSVTTFEKSTRAAAETADELKMRLVDVAEAGERFSGIGDAADKLQEAIDGIIGNARSLSENLEKLAQKAEADFDRIANAQDQHELVLRHTVTEIKETNDALSDALKIATHELTKG